MELVLKFLLVLLVFFLFLNGVVEISRYLIPFLCLFKILDCLIEEGVFLPAKRTNSICQFFSEHIALNAPILILLT